MENRENKNELYWALGTGLGLMAAYFFAVLDLPYFYYQLLRIASVILLPVFAFNCCMISNKILDIVTIFSAIILILFNPFLPIYMDKDTWVVFDILSSISIAICTVITLVRYYSKK